MAQVARDPRQRQDLDYHLEYQLRAWESVPEYAELWPDLDSVDREVFHLEWVGITESRLQQLQQWAELGLLTLSQQDRFEQLLGIVARHRPTVEALLNE